MTTATTEGRRLRLEVEGVQEPFLVDPLPARRGRILTDEFIKASLGQRSIAQSEAIFIEALGASNYARMTGQYVDEFDASTGRFLATWGAHGTIRTADSSYADERDVDPGVRFIARDPSSAEPLEPEFDGEAIRQEECESIALCAFYWQTVVGMEAVQGFIEEGEGTRGSLKALSLLQTRLGLSIPATSRSEGMESLTQQAGSGATTDTPSSFGSVRLPADHKPPQRQKGGRGLSFSRRR